MIRWPRPAARAWVSWIASRIGIPGNSTRAGRSPNHRCSSRRDVNNTRARVRSANSRRNSTNSACSSAVHIDGVPVGNPATGSTLSQIHSTGTCARTCTATSRRCRSSNACQATPERVNNGSNTSANSLSTTASGLCCSNDENSTTPSPNRTSANPPVDRYQPANSTAVDVFPLPANACSNTIRWPSNARSNASNVSSRPKNPTSGRAGNRSSCRTGCAPGSATSMWTCPRPLGVNSVTGAASYTTGTD